eukprot:m.114972 g.114972  ORF g.114972 m.114972 type:complete len:111 (-) comp12833_c2_seq12:2954-3286(-)
MRRKESLKRRESKQREGSITTTLPHSFSPARRPISQATSRRSEPFNVGSGWDSTAPTVTTTTPTTTPHQQEQNDISGGNFQRRSTASPQRRRGSFLKCTIVNGKKKFSII